MLMECEYDLIAQLQRISEIRLYGKGYVSGILSEWLHRRGISINRYIVTQMTPCTSGGDKVITLEEAEQEKTLPVLVAVTSKHRCEIERDLVQRGFTNIITLTDECIEKISWLLNRGLYFMVHIVEHCNLKCRGCYHFSSLAKESFLGLQEFEKDIQRLSQLFSGHMNRIMLLGGEPLLHPEAEKFFRIARKCFPHGTIQLLTNGLYLLNKSAEFYNTVRECDGELWVTKYPVNFDYEKAEDYAASFGIKLQYFNKEPVRTLGHQPLDIDGKQNSRKNFIHCYRANECVDLKHGKMYPCIIPAEIAPFCDYFDVKILVDEDDGVDIYKVETGEELLDLLKRPIPFCKYCNREKIKIFGEIPWCRTKYDIREWTD